jgi:hypothetical protein
VFCLDIESEFNVTVITPESVRHDYSLLPVSKYKIYIKADEAVTQVCIAEREKYNLHVIIKYVMQYSKISGVYSFK